MATKTVRFMAPTGLSSVTAEVYAQGSDTIINTGGDTCTEATNRKGMYEFAFTEANSAGLHIVVVKVDSVAMWPNLWLYLPGDTAATYYCTDDPLAVNTSGQVQGDVRQYGGTNGTFSGGIPAVNATQISGDSTAADNCEAMFDGTGYAGGTSKLQVQLANSVTHGGSGATFTMGSTTLTSLTVTGATNLLTGLTIAGDFLIASVAWTTVIWNALTSVMSTSGGIGKLLVDTLTGHVPQTGDSYAIINGMLSDSGTAQAGAAGSITLKSGASSDDDFYNGCVVKIVSGAGAGQNRQITDYVGSTRVATVDTNWVTNPDNTSVYQVLGRIV